MKAAHIGKVLGAFGLLLLLSSPFTFFFTSGSALVAGVKASLGIACLAAYFATHYKTFGQLGSGRASFFVASSALMAVVSLGGLMALNYIAFKKNQSWDLTAEKIFTLAPQTQSTLEGLKEKVRAIAFLPAGHAYYDTVQDLFERYHAVAPEKFEYAFKDPRRNPDLAAKYKLKEGQATVVLVTGTGDTESHALLNVISEQELTNALLRLVKVGEQKVYFISGHGEWPLELLESAPGEQGLGLGELRQQLLQEGYSAETLNLAGKTEVPRDASLLVIAGAKTRFTPPEEETLRQYLAAGGRMLYFAEAGVDSGLDKLLAEYGVEVDAGVAADAQFNSGHPYAILSLFYTEHEIARPLRRMEINIEFPTSRSLSILHEGLAPGVQVEPVVLTSPYGWVETTPTEEAVQSDGEKTGQLTLVAASTRDTSSAQDKRFDQARVVVVGDSEIILDVNWGHEANRNLVMNALGWTTQQLERITIRPPDRAVSTLQLEPAMMDRIRFVSTDLLPMMVLGLGLAIWLSRRNK